MIAKNKLAKSIVFVVDTLAQHGAERYLLEIIKVLADTDHKLTVYSIVPLQGNSTFYVKPLQELGVEVVINDGLPFPTIKSKVLKRIYNTISYRVVNRVDTNFIADRQGMNVINFISKFDEVSIIKWEVYKSYPSLFDTLPRKKIHLLSTLAQYDDYPYEQLPGGETEFVLMFDEQQQELLAGREGTGITFSTIPLLVDNAEWPVCYSPKEDGIFRIGIFSRINQDQPTIFALFVIHELQTKGIAVELYFFGRYYNESFYKHYLKTAETLRIADCVKFMGHTTDMQSAIRDNNLNIALMNSMSNVIGYSSIEIQSFGLPTIFFNVSKYLCDRKTYPAITNTMNEIVDIMEHYSKSSAELQAFSESVFLNAKKEYGIGSNRSKIINIYQ